VEEYGILTTDFGSPFASVIIPVRNAPGHIRRCLDALMEQTYPRDRFEIIVVDNGSTDKTPQVIAAYPVQRLVETSMASPYPARNRGIRHAQGAIIALLDADCTPVADWLERGVAPLVAGTADMVGGNVVFTFSEHNTVAEQLDSIMHLNVQDSIERVQACPTANLFVRAALFRELGGFPARVRSGGDMAWTGRASRAGYTLRYEPAAKVYKPARRLRALLRKSFRIGTGGPALFLDRGETPPRILLLTLRGLLPARLSVLHRMIIRRGTPEMLGRFWQLWLVYWLARSASSLGRLRGLLAPTADAKSMYNVADD
jgi:glycosyltransferase involved in cell wall biosynthesis